MANHNLFHLVEPDPAGLTNLEITDVVALGGLDPRRYLDSLSRQR